MRDLMPKILGFLVIIITLALAPSISTANTAIAASNLTSLIGMTALVGFGAPLIILGLLISGGIFAVAGTRGALGGAKIADLMSVIGTVVVLIVVLTMFVSVIEYVQALILVSSGFAVTIYGLIPITIYIGVIALAGWTQVKTFRGARRGSRKASANY